MKYWVITKEIDATFKKAVKDNNGVWDGEDDGSSYVIIPDENDKAFNEAADQSGAEFDWAY